MNEKQRRDARKAREPNLYSLDEVVRLAKKWDKMTFETEMTPAEAWVGGKEIASLAYWLCYFLRGESLYVREARGTGRKIQKLLLDLQEKAWDASKLAEGLGTKCR